MHKQDIGFRRKHASPSGHHVQSPVTQPTENQISARPHARYSGSRLKNDDSLVMNSPNTWCVRSDCSQLSFIRLAAEAAVVKHDLTV